MRNLQFLELKVPPALVFVIFGVLMYFLDSTLPVGEFDFFGRGLLLKVLIGLAVLVTGIALLQFARHKTTVDPTKPQSASHLVTTGIYRFTRNPMYLGMLLLLLAFGMHLGNAFNTLLAAGYVAYMNRFQIGPEERHLAVVFGNQFKQYCLQTRRWF